jgi:hypothetical protein
VKSPEQTETGAKRQMDELAQLLKKAEQGDRSVLPQLREALDRNEDLWRGFGDLASHAEASLILLAAGPNLLLSESLQRKLRALKKELGGESPSPLERLLVERATATWLQVSYYDALLAQAKGANEARLKMLQTQQDAAHRRHLTALKTLATVRKLLTPTPAPVEIATRLDRGKPGVRRGSVAVAGAVPVQN